MKMLSNKTLKQKSCQPQKCYICHIYLHVSYLGLVGRIDYNNL